MALEQSEAPEFDVAAQCERMINCRIGGYPQNWGRFSLRKHAIEMLLFELMPGHHISAEKERFLGIYETLKELKGEERDGKKEELLAQIRVYLEAELVKKQQQ